MVPFLGDCGDRLFSFSYFFLFQFLPNPPRAGNSFFLTGGFGLAFLFVAIALSFLHSAFPPRALDKFVTGDDDSAWFLSLRSTVHRLRWNFFGRASLNTGHFYVLLLLFSRNLVEGPRF